jgi:hypothetical protein
VAVRRVPDEERAAAAERRGKHGVTNQRVILRIRTGTSPIPSARRASASTCDVRLGAGIVDRVVEVDHPLLGITAACGE